VKKEADLNETNPKHLQQEDQKHQRQGTLSERGLQPSVVYQPLHLQDEKEDQQEQYS